MDQFEAFIDAGATTTDLANALVDSTQFKSLRYSDTLNNNDFATAVLENLLGNLVNRSHLALAETELETWLDSGFSRGEIFVKLADALSAMSPDDAIWGAAATQFSNKVEVSAFYAIQNEGWSLSLTTLQQVTANVTDLSASVVAAKKLLDSGWSGEVIDGYVRGATVFVDTDGDGTQSPNEANTITDAQGSFDFPAGIVSFGRIIASGGTIIATTQSFAGKLTAPAGSTVVTPLTTLIDELASHGSTVTAAKTLVATALDLDLSVDLTSFDSLSVSLHSASDSPAGSAPLKIQSTGAKINTLVTQIAALLNGASVTTNQDLGISAAYMALANYLENNAGFGTIDLSALTTISAIINGASSELGANTDQRSNIANLAGGVSPIIANLNKAIDEAVSNSISSSDALTQIKSIQVVARDIESAVKKGAATGNTIDAFVATLGDAFLNAVSAASRNLGDIDGDGFSDATTPNSLILTVGVSGGGTVTVAFRNTEDVVTLSINSAGYLVFTDSRLVAQTIPYKVADIAQGGIPAVALTASTFAHADLAEKLAFASAAVDATGASAAELRVVADGVTRISPNGLSNLTITNSQTTTEIASLLVKATDVLVSATGMESSELAALSTKIANVALDGITGMMVLNTAMHSNAQITALLGEQTADGSEVSLNGNVMSAAAAKLLLRSGLSGEVIDGYVSGATVFIDKDGDGTLDLGEPNTVTDALGNFRFPEGASVLGQIIAIGGTDIATGQPFAGPLTAPIGSSVVTPLTTLIGNIMSVGGVSLTAAKVNLAASFGLDVAVDLVNFDPLEVLSKTPPNAETRNAALKIQAAAVKVNTLATQIAAALKGAEVPVDNDAGISAAYAALASKLMNNPSAIELDLSAADFILGIINEAASRVGANLAEVATDTSTVISNINVAVNIALTDISDPFLALVQFASIQLVSNDVEFLITSGTSAGSMGDAVAATSGAAFQDAISAAGSKLGDVNGDGQSDAIEQAPEPEQTPIASVLQPTFLVTETAGTVAFSGTSTANIEVTWAGTVGDSVATFTRSSVVATTRPDFNGTANAISIAAGQTMSMSLADAFAIAVTASKAIEGAGSVIATDAAIAAADLNTLYAAITATLDARAATTITGTGAEFGAAIGSLNLTLPAAFAASVSASPTVSQVNAIDAVTSGVVTASLSDTATQLATLTGTTGAYTLTLSGTTIATVAELKAMNAATTGSITLNGETTANNWSDTPADLVLAFDGITSLSGTVAATGTVTTVAQANALTSATSGVVTATISDTPAQLATLVGNTGAYTLTLAGTNIATVAELKAINAATTGPITLNVETADNNWSGTPADLVPAFDGITSLTGAIVATGTTSVAQANALNAATSGVVTADLVGLLSTFSTLTGTGNAYNIALDDDNDFPLSAAFLSALGAKTTGVVTVARAVHIIDKVAEAKGALVTAETLVEAAIAKVTLTDLGTTAIAAADLSAIGGATTGLVTVAYPVAISGTAAEVVAALVTGDTKVIASTATVEISALAVDGGINASAVLAENTGDVDLVLAPSDTSIVITGFDNSTDHINFDALTNDGALTRSGARSLYTASPDNVVYFSAGAPGDADTVEASIALMNANLNYTDSANTFYAVVPDDDSTAIYKVTGDGAGDKFTGDTIVLVGTIDSSIPTQSLVF